MNHVRFALFWLLLACAPAGLAQPGELEPLELEDYEVIGTLTLRQEAAFRSLRMAMDQPYSSRREDAGKWRCWFEKPVGSRLNHLHCARIGDLNSPVSVEASGVPDIARVIPMAAGADGGTLVSKRPMNEGKVRRIMESVLGPAVHDEAFVGIARSGQQPPDDVPSADELDRFARAWRNVDELYAAGADEDQQIRAIEQTGLSLDRFNRIATLVESYPYIHSQVSLRLRN